MMSVIPAQNGNLEDVKTLLEAGIFPQGNSGNHRFALHAACLHGHLAIVQALLEQEADVNAFEGQTDSALIPACLSGNLALVILLIAWDADIPCRKHPARRSAARSKQRRLPNYHEIAPRPRLPSRCTM